MNLKKQFIFSSLWTVGAAAFSNLSSLIVFILLARLLSPEEFGTVAFATTIIALTRVFITAGIPDALIRRPVWDISLASTAFWTSLGLGVTVTAVILLGIAPGLFMLYNEEFALVLAALSLSLIVEGFTAIHIAQLRRDFLYKVIARRSIAANVVSGVLGVVLAYDGWGVWAMVVSHLAAVSSTSLILWFSSDFRPRWSFSFAHLAEIGKFSGGVLGSQLLNQAGTQIPPLLIGGLLGPAAIAQYRVGSRSLDLIISLVIAPIQSTAVSVLGRFATDKSGLGRAYARLTKSCALVACPIMLGIAGIAPDFVPLAFGPQWAEASYVLVAMCLIAGPVTLGYFEAATMNAAGRSDLTLRTSLAGSLGNILAGSVGLLFGPIGVAAALTIRAHLTMPYALHLIRIATGVNPLKALASIAPAYFGALSMAICVTLLRLFAFDDYEQITRLILCIICGSVIYPLFMFLFFRSYVQTVLHEALPILPAKLARVVARI